MPDSRNNGNGWASYKGCTDSRAAAFCLLSVWFHDMMCFTELIALKEKENG
jgi:hypothetical protein